MQPASTCTNKVLTLFWLSSSLRYRIVYSTSMGRPRLASSHETFTVPGGVTSSAARKTAGRGVAKWEKQGWLNIKSRFNINLTSLRVALFQGWALGKFKLANIWDDFSHLAWPCRRKSYHEEVRFKCLMIPLWTSPLKALHPLHALTYDYKLNSFLWHRDCMLRLVKGKNVCLKIMVRYEWDQSWHSVHILSGYSLRATFMWPYEITVYKLIVILWVHRFTGEPR